MRGFFLCIFSTIAGSSKLKKANTFMLALTLMSKSLT